MSDTIIISVSVRSSYYTVQPDDIMRCETRGVYSIRNDHVSMKMTLSESSAGLTLADFLYSRLSPISKYNVKSDYHRHNPPGEHHNNSQKPPTHILRGPKFIAADVRPEQTKGKQVSRAVSSFRAALNNIVGIKESLFRTLLPPPRPRGKKPYEGVGTDQGSEDVGTVGGSDWEQFNSGNNYFRPSLTDPLRPTVKIISSVPAGSAPTRFLPPRERTKIDTAVVGQQVKPRRAENTEIKTQSYTVGSLVPLQHSVEKIKGRLKVPEERTFIDTAVFADDIFQKKPLPTRTFEPLRTSQTQSESSDSSWVILGGDKSQEFVRVSSVLFSNTSSEHTHIHSSRIPRLHNDSSKFSGVSFK